MARPLGIDFWASALPTPLIPLHPWYEPSTRAARLRTEVFGATVRRPAFAPSRSAPVRPAKPRAAAPCCGLSMTPGGVTIAPDLRRPSLGWLDFVSLLQKRNTEDRPRFVSMIVGMKLDEIIWPGDRIDHIARHNVTPDEVEEVCFGRPLVLRAKSEGSNPVYYVLGQTASGRHLFCVIIQFPEGPGYPVTARPMTQSEKQRFEQWKRR
jgi:uncharacterized DUF497 family protein